MFLFIFYNCLSNSSKIVSIIKSIIYGYIIFSFILVTEFIYLFILSGTPADGAIGWKNLIIKFGFYPQTVTEDQLQGWSSLGSMTGIFTVHHSLAIYLGSIFFLILGSNLNSLFSKKFRIFLLISLLFFIFLTNSRFIILSMILILIYHFRIFFLKYRLKLFLMLSIAFSVFSLGDYSRFHTIYYTVSQILFIFSQNLNNLNVVSDYIYQYSNEFASDASSSYRLLYNFNSIRLIFDYPFFGSGKLGLILSGSDKANPHSLYLIFLQRFGLIPFIFFIWFIILVFRRSFRFLSETSIVFGLSSFYVYLFFLLVSLGIFSLSDLRTSFIFLFSIVIISRKGLISSNGEISC